MKTPISAKCLMYAGLIMATSSAWAVTSPGSAVQLFKIDPTPERQVLQRTGTAYMQQLLADPANEQVTLIELTPTLLTNQTQELTVTLPDGKAAQFHLRDFTPIAQGIDGWVGYKPSTWKQAHAPSSATEIDYDPLYYLSLAREGDKLVGSVIVEGQRYRIDHIGDGQHVLIKVDESKLPKEAEPLKAQDVAVDNTIGKAPQSAHSIIRVMFLATNQRKAASPNYKLELANALNTANQYLKNSKVDLTYELAGFYEGAYDEAGRTYQQQLNDLRPAEPFAGEVLARRELLGADLVSMYSTVSAVCGVAWLSASKVQGHSVISCPGSLAHELGHNLGVNHGWKEGDSISNPPYMHGYRSEGSPAFHTQMITSHGAIPYFSNPRLTYQGAALGTVDHHDAARRINERRETVENYYPPVLINVTVFDNPGMQGDSCSFDLPAGNMTTTLIEDVCGSAWVRKVWSARVKNMTAGKTLRLGNSVAYHSYTSTSYAGDFDVPTLSAHPLEMPEGMVLTPNNGNLTKLIEQVEIRPL